MINSNSVDDSKRKKAIRKLENYIKTKYIFIDTCSLLEPSSYIFWSYAMEFLEKYNKKITIPYKCIEEIERHEKNLDNQSLAKKAKETKKLLGVLKKKQLISIRYDKGDGFADNLFLTRLTQHRIQYPLLLITQDNNLAKDIERRNEDRSVNAYKVLVKRIRSDGLLDSFKWQNNSRGNNIQKDHAKRKKNNKYDNITAFDSVTNLPSTQLDISYIPKENDNIYLENSNVILTLKEKIAYGGEGAIYTVNDDRYVAKIYRKEAITIRKFEKIKLMLTKKIKYDGICYPICMILNLSVEFVGYLMPYAKGKELQKSIFIKPLFFKYFPNWRKRDTVQLCITILEKIKYLHDRNVIIGDINPNNILVVSPTQVYFVDVDSYQVANFPCPVGTINYTAPEIQRKHFPDFLRTIGNENFAVATLLFMIMLPGKPPYSQQGGDDPITNIMNMDFSYPLGDNSNKKTPDGAWRFIWSHLTYDLKYAFYNTFRKNGDYSSEYNRLSVDKWLSLFKYYLSLLDSGKYGEQDKMSEELFPTRYKKIQNL